jgi:NAD-dependent deacetylase
MTCDAMIIACASLAVSPANTLPLHAKNIKATLIKINPENTPLSNEMDFSVRKTSVDPLPTILSIFESLN